MTNEIKSTLDSIVKILIDLFSPAKIVLFGSHARGDERPDSDIDLLIVLETVESKRAAAVEMYKALRHIPGPKDLVVTTQDELLRYQNISGTILKPALLEGKILYEAGPRAGNNR
jgi:predicted nucleotidyltransferase